MEKQQFLALIDKYLDGRASIEEEQMLLNYYGSFQNSRGWDEKVLGVKEEIEKRLLGRIQNHVSRTRVKEPVRLWPRIAAAAVILLVVGAGLFFYTSYYAPRHLDDRRDPLSANDIAPGKVGATLTLANGKTIVLSEAKNGELAKESGVAITKTANGQLVYVISSEHSGENRALRELSGAKSLPAVEMTNTLTTTKGETVQVRLPDGTAAWLNAGSTLKYPASFVGGKNRRVELSGEAYFEVAKDKDHPFMVQTDKQLVEVLGTHFNINSYSYEQETKTTLLEGSVKVTSYQSAPSSRGTEGSLGHATSRDLSHSRDDGKVRDKGQSAILKPGEQSLVTTGFLKIIPVDVEVATAWKNGNFLFREEKLESVLNRLAYWYDVEIIYEGKKPIMVISGVIKRKRKLSLVLDLISMSGGVNFRIEGRKVYVEK